MTLCGPSFAADAETDAYLSKRPLLMKMSTGLTDEQKRCVRVEMTKVEQDPSRPNITAARGEAIVQSCRS